MVVKLTNFALKLDHFYLKVWPILPLKLKYVYYYVGNHKKHCQLDSFIVPLGIYFGIEEECQEEEK